MAYQLKEPGKYHGTLADVCAGLSKKNQTPHLVLSFEIHYVWDNATSDWIAVEPFTRICSLWLTEKAINRTYEKLFALGFKGNPADPDLNDFDEKIVDGLELKCSHKEDDKGVMREEWAPVLFFDGSYAPDEMDQETIATHQNLYKNFLASKEVPFS